MEIFITGATGFIGKCLVQALSQKGYKFRCLVRKTSNIDFIAKENCEFVYGDVTDKESLLKGMEGCDWVVNLANIYSMWEPDKSIYYKVNVEGTRNVMLSALETGVKKVIHISSVVIFGKPDDCPFTEKSSPGPRRFSEYARTKFEGDKIAWELFENHKLPLVVLYPAAVLGPGDTKTTGQYIHLIVKRKMPALACNNSILTWVHVKDVVDAIVSALEKDGNIGEKYIIGKETLSIDGINSIIKEIAETPLPKIILPYPITFLMAFLLTKMADFIKKSPLWGMSIDQIKTLKEGFQVDGNKAERELGIHYRTIREAIKEMLA